MLERILPVMPEMPDLEIPERPAKTPAFPALKAPLKDLDFSKSTDFHQGPISRRGGHAIVAWSFAAASIDALIIFSLCCFIFAVGSEVLGLKLHALKQIMTPSIVEALAIFVLSFAACYLIFLRGFLSFTCGEWACGLRLGHPKQRRMSSYLLKVTARTLLIFSTGLIVLPALSLMSGKDLPGLLIKLPLVSLK
jgi:hypothetical protein